jgi:transcription elongation factor Elf1
MPHQLYFECPRCGDRNVVCVAHTWPMPRLMCVKCSRPNDYQAQQCVGIQYYNREETDPCKSHKS